MSRPRAPILIYDGDCGVCLRSVEWLRYRFRRPVQLVASQDVDLARYDLTDGDVARAAWWIDEHGRKSAGHAAIARALGACNGAWSALGWALRLPLAPVAWLGYRLLARWRHRLPATASSPRACGTRRP